MWSKGAVVVVKRGDPAMGDAMLSGMGFETVPSHQIEKLKRDNYFLKRKATKAEARAVRKAKALYGYNPPAPPEWAKPLVDIYALAVYGYATFVDKYLVLHDPSIGRHTAKGKARRRREY